ncbi:MAG: hypothetical protein GEV06_09410 [Luteitalea sp.]|nr:hypothetical protein [Luteitalea sp.]
MHRAGTAARRTPEAWGSLLADAARIVKGYDTPVTLRQLFYRLVSAGVLRNTRAEYTQLSHRTAAARRAGTFPALMDRNRRIDRPVTFTSVADARRWLASLYRRDRTEGQAVSVYLAIEKAGLVAQLRAWFGDLGLPVLPLGGYSSESFESEVVDDVRGQGRSAVLLYAGDFDPSG